MYRQHVYTGKAWCAVCQPCTTWHAHDTLAAQSVRVAKGLTPVAHLPGCAQACAMMAILLRFNWRREAQRAAESLGQEAEGAGAGAPRAPKQQRGTAARPGAAAGLQGDSAAELAVGDEAGRASSAAERASAGQRESLPAAGLVEVSVEDSAQLSGLLPSLALQPLEGDGPLGIGGDAPYHSRLE
jgi:hypothetical protein